jgi:hypothetical protein
MQRIRYYGLLGNRHREEKLAQCRQLLKMEPQTPTKKTDGEAPDDADHYRHIMRFTLRSINAATLRTALFRLPGISYSTSSELLARHHRRQNALLLATDANILRQSLHAAIRSSRKTQRSAQYLDPEEHLLPYWGERQQVRKGKDCLKCWT